MFGFVCKFIGSSNSTLHLFKLYSTNATKSISLQNGNQESFTVKYLMNQCGYSLQKAVLASSKYVNFKKPDKPDSVITFFKNQGFDDSQIKKLVSIHPRILSSDPQKTLLPKIQFFISKGFEKKDLARIISCTPNYVRRSLENCIVPSFNFIQDFLGSEKDAVLAISECPRVLLEVDRRVKPSIQILVGAGMSPYAIAHLFKTRPSVFVHAPDKFDECVEHVQNMGMDPSSSSFASSLSIIIAQPR